MRTFEIFKDGKYISCGLSDIRKDDTFQIFDNGVQFMSDKGKSVFIAAGRSFIREDGEMSIHVY